MRGPETDYGEVGEGLPVFDLLYLTVRVLFEYTDLSSDDELVEACTKTELIFSFDDLRGAGQCALGIFSHPRVKLAIETAQKILQCLPDFVEAAGKLIDPDFKGHDHARQIHEAARSVADESDAGDE